MENKVYKGYQTIIPSEIKKFLGVKRNDITNWDLNEDGTVNLKFKKPNPLNSLAGIVSSSNVSDAVKIKKQSQRGSELDIHRY